MKPTTSFKKYFIEITGYSYLLLFTYAAFSKLSEYETFVVQLGQSPLLSAFAGWVSWFIPVIEISIALMLMFKQTQFLALNASFILMSMFTAYIYIILNYSEYIPCSCGGILEKMSWTEHLYFNIICCLIAIVAIIFYLQLLEHKNIKHKITLLTTTTIVATAFVYFLFLRSEQIIHQENNFVRRYPPHLYNRMSKLNLIYGGYYFAGTSHDTLYLGNYHAPLSILAISSDLRKTKQHKIRLSNYDLPFQAASVRITNDNFFLSDGTIPCLFIGKIQDWNAKQITIAKKRFSAFEPISPTKAVIRSRKPQTNESTLGLLHFSNNKSDIKWNHKVLEKQVDGVFDCDGILSYNNNLKKIIYTYYYRNQFSVSNDNLELQFRQNTIDTTKIARIKIAQLKNGDRKMAQPPLVVNKLISAAGNQLFVNSNLRGHFESAIRWKQSTPVDVYNIKSKEYDYSFQVYNLNQKKPTAMFATENIVYFIFDKTLIAYKIDRTVRR